MIDAPSGLRALRLRLRYEPSHPWPPPPAPAVTFRGALGAALYELGCAEPHRDCTICERAAACPVVPWYGPSALRGHALRPYALRAWTGPALGPGLPFQAELVVLGRPPAELAAALVRVGEAGLGADRVPHRLASLLASSEAGEVELIDLDGQVSPLPRSAALEAACRPPPPSIAGARLHLCSPLDLGQGGDPDPRELLRAALGRLRAIARSQGRPVDRRWPDPGAVEARWLERRWVQGARWSDRQGGEVPLSGWVGTVELGAGVAEFADLLAVAELVQVGRGVTAGMGWVSVEWVPPAG